MPFDRISLYNIDPPATADINAELQWIGGVFGVFGERDKDSSCFRVFVTIVHATQQEGGVTSDDIAARCKLARGTVVHHINKLRDTGLVAPSPGGYRLAQQNMAAVLAGIEDEVQRILSVSKIVAKDIDRKLRL